MTLTSGVVVTLEFFLYRATLRFLLGSCIVGNQDLFHLAEKSPSRTSGSFPKRAFAVIVTL
jgi:hypothetical protein